MYIYYVLNTLGQVAYLRVRCAFKLIAATVPPAVERVSSSILRTNSTEKIALFIDYLVDTRSHHVKKK